MTRKVLDTNIFNRLANGTIEPSILPQSEYLVTKWQRRELLRTKSPERRERLLAVFCEINPTEVRSSSTPWGSPWGSAWDQGGKYFESILADLERLKPGDRGNKADAVIIETALYERACFVSDDYAASEIAASYGVATLTFEQLLNDS